MPRRRHDLPEPATSNQTDILNERTSLPISACSISAASWPGPGRTDSRGPRAPTSSRSSGPATATTRSWGPPFLAAADGAPSKESGYFLSVNRGKRSVTVDLATAEGQATIREIAAHCDVVLENFKAGDASALRSLGYDDLKAVKPEPHLLLDHRLRPDRTEAATTPPTIS